MWVQFSKTDNLKARYLNSKQMNQILNVKITLNVFDADYALYNRVCSYNVIRYFRGLFSKPSFNIITSNPSTNASTPRPKISYSRFFLLYCSPVVIMVLFIVKSVIFKKFGVCFWDNCSCCMPLM